MTEILTPTSNDPTETLRIGLIQTCSSRDVDRNMSEVSALIRTAAASGARYVQTPEVTTLMEMKRDDLFAKADVQSGNRAVQAFSDLAAELRIWLHVGSMVVKVADDKVANRALIFAPDGRLVATYDKIHMFDVELPGGERYRESKNFRAGSTAKLVDTPFGKLGVTICYDMRFAGLYDGLTRAGATLLTAPSAFTVPTGTAHWHTLLRARAIETQCFMLAAAQAGAHECGRATYGHSLVVSPWGEVIAEGSADAVEVVLADLDLSSIATARARVPSRNHIVPFTVESISGEWDPTPAVPLKVPANAS